MNQTTRKEEIKAVFTKEAVIDKTLEHFVGADVLTSQSPAAQAKVDEAKKFLSEAITVIHC